MKRKSQKKNKNKNDDLKTKYEPPACIHSAPHSAVLNFLGCILKLSVFVVQMVASPDNRGEFHKGSSLAMSCEVWQC